MRQILNIEVNHVGLVGTYHRPSPNAMPTPRALRPAVLLLNFGQVRRCGPGNLSADMADRLCRQGYPVFRFDMPGLGDTPGDLPAYHETYWRSVESGEQVKWVCGLMAAIKRQFPTPGFILGGLCGGALTGILVAERRRSSVLGLILMEPAVRRTPPLCSEGVPHAASSSLGLGAWRSLQRTLTSLVCRIRLKASNTKWFGTLRHGYRSTERMVCSLRGKQFPAMMNAPVILCWQRLEASKLPMLVMMAPGTDRDFIKQAVFPGERRSRMICIDMDGTNHLFTAGDGKQVAIDVAAGWMSVNYPIGANPIAVAGDQPSKAGLARSSTH